MKDLRKDVEWDCDLVIMNAGLRLAEMGLQEGFDALAEIGITGDLKQVTQRVRGKVTNHELNKKTKPETEDITADFPLMLAQVNKLGYNVRGDVLLWEWIGILKLIEKAK